ncbi:DUF1990 family protein [uncultured Amnibacterium sp.]|uniref:DUF1990 family protein n=1 Tax=uncultured Amnibacterium sp. TaxID=1631851 RepID=UPI0035C9C8DA
MTTVRVGGPMRRGGAVEPDRGLNYAAINATTSVEVVAFPPFGFASAQYRHRIGSGARRFDVAGRALMTWGGLRAAGYGVVDVRAEPEADWPLGAGPRFLDDGTPWITPGMTALLTSTDPAMPAGPVKVVSTVEEPGRIGFVWGSMPGHVEIAERYLVVEHDDEDGVWVTLRTIWDSPVSRLGRLARAAAVRQRRIDERIVRALHPSHSA